MASTFPSAGIIGVCHPSQPSPGFEHPRHYFEHFLAPPSASILLREKMITNLTEEDIEAQRGQVIHLRSHTQPVSGRDRVPTPATFL